MDEETVVHPFDGILLGREKERTLDTGDNRDDPQMHPDSKSQTQSSHIV